MDTLSTVFAALSDPTRRQIVDRLTRGRASVNELAAPFAISQQAISKHIAYLERARLVDKRREGREHFCTLNPGVIRDVAVWAQSYRRFWEESYDRLETLLEDLQQQPAKPARGRAGTSKRSRDDGGK